MYADLAASCASAGFDLAAPFRVEWYNRAVDPSLRLPDFGSPDRLGVVIGNSRALWRVLPEALRHDPALRDALHPIEAYTVRTIGSAVASIASDAEIRWSQTVGDGMVAIQRLAEIAGLAHQSPAHLCVHPTFGPWIALRAAVVFDVAGPTGDPPVTQRPCDHCEEACAQRFAALMEGPPTERDWRAWLSVRASCPIGREHRYSDDESEYHATKSRAVLERILSR